MKLYALLILLCGGAQVLAQFENADLGPLPQRALVSGDAPVPSGPRPPFRRQRTQVPGGGRPVALPPPNVAVRGRRPVPGPGRTLGAEPAFLNTVTPPIPTSPPQVTLAQAYLIQQEQPLATAAPPPPPPPVVEEVEDEEDYDLEDEPVQPHVAPQTPSPRPSAFGPRPQNLQPAVFRPTRPVFKPAPQPPVEPTPILRQQARPRPPAPSPASRPLPDEEDLPVVTRGQGRPFRPSPAPQQVPVRQPTPQPQQQYTRPNGRVKKPVAQVIRRYREDNPDGSITWGFENDDGTFKEETIGVDCTVRGKYGYNDPDGVRREYAYSSGIPCDKEARKKQQEGSEGYVDYQNKYLLPNGQYVDLDSVVKNKARKPVQQAFRA